MTFEELLKGIDELTDEQAAAIKAGMKENKIHLSAEENIDERYGKLKVAKLLISSGVGSLKFGYLRAKGARRNVYERRPSWPTRTSA